MRISRLSTRRSSTLCGLSALALLVLSGVPASAQTMYQPTSVSTDMGTSTLNSSYDLNNLINQSGLMTPYLSGVTDLSAYNSTSDINWPSSIWSSAFGTTTGTVTFDLGSVHTISDLVFWNVNAGAPGRVIGFSLAASNDSAFSSGVTSLGAFTTNSTGGFPTVNQEVFSFTATSARYFRMTITSNAGANATGFGEAAFAGVAPGATAAPEPGSLALLALGALTGGVVLRRRPKTRPGP